VDDLNKDALIALLKSLTADADADADAEEPKGFYVKEGKSMTSLSGLKDAGDLVREKDLPGGLERLKELVKKGVLRQVK